MFSFLKRFIPWTRVASPLDPSLLQILEWPFLFILYHVPPCRGGGAVKVARSNLKVWIETQQNLFSSFEYLNADVRSRHQVIQLVDVYRPPYSKKNRATTNVFLSEFRTFLKDILTRPGQLLMLGDFNFHWKLGSLDTRKFSALLSSLGLKQHVRTSTYDRVHALEHAITRTECNLISSVNVNRLLPSDNALILLELINFKPQNKLSKRGILLIYPSNLLNPDFYPWVT